MTCTTHMNNSCVTTVTYTTCTTHMCTCTIAWIFNNWRWICIKAIIIDLNLIANHNYQETWLQSIRSLFKHYYYTGTYANEWARRTIALCWKHGACLLTVVNRRWRQPYFSIVRFPDLKANSRTVFPDSKFENTPETLQNFPRFPWICLWTP